MDLAYEALEEIVEYLHPIEKSDTDNARSALAKYPKLSSRDSLHLAVMKRIRCSVIWSFDTGFDQVRELKRYF